MLNHTNLLLLFIYCCYYVNCEYLELREGKKCLYKGINGTCVNIFKCPKAKHDIITSKEYPPICAFNDKEPIICCTNCYPYTDSDLRNEVFNPHIGLLRMGGTVAGNKFNEYLDKLEYPCKLHRIAFREFRMDETNNCHFYTDTSTGFSAEGITYPRTPGLMHTVVLGYGEDLETAQWLCGGSIISENYILTAANCTAMPDLGPVKFVAMGPLNSSGLVEPWQSLRVKRAIPHPEYQPSSKYHDIALLKTATPIMFSNQVTPISVKTDNVFWPSAIAWRELGQGQGLVDTLDSVALTDLKDHTAEECSLLYPPQQELASGFNHTTQICFGKEIKDVDELTSEEEEDKKIDVCKGDNGAPIQTKDSTTCAFSLIGVTSIGRTCKETRMSALYTRVEFYRPWIESIVWPTVTVSEKAKEDEKAAAEGWGFDGDRGGSIVATDNTFCAYNILGVTSLGRVCGEAGGTALYTKVDYYVPWIEKIVWPGEYFSYTKTRRKIVEELA